MMTVMMMMMIAKQGLCAAHTDSLCPFASIGRRFDGNLLCMRYRTTVKLDCTLNILILSRLVGSSAYSYDVTLVVYCFRP